MMMMVLGGALASGMWHLGSHDEHPAAQKGSSLDAGIAIRVNTLQLD